MALILKSAFKGYRFLFEELSDPRTNTWFLVAKPYQGLTLLGLYLLFVLKWGPDWMKNRPAFNLDKILIVYNVIQIIFCTKLFISSLLYAWLFDYQWICEPVDFSNSESALRIANYVYFYYLIKIIDLLDTVFFVLRKKFNQVSFLHVYHHTGMVMLTWGAATYFPGGHGTLVGVINSFVHVVMYGYYLLTVAVPSVKNSLWWKKYITQLQILQFFWTVVHMSTLVFKTDCAYPRWIAAVFLPQNLFMLILFIDFYIKSYIKTNKVKAANGVPNGLKNDHANGASEGNGHVNGVSAGKAHANGVLEGNGHVNGVSAGKAHANGVLEGNNDNSILEGNGHATGISSKNGHVKKE